MSREGLSEKVTFKLDLMTVEFYSAKIYGKGMVALRLSKSKGLKFEQAWGFTRKNEMKYISIDHRKGSGPVL